ncbi:MAG: NAD-dependent epimerase/dehydratase family protein [Bacteroidota bacterium]
MMKILITGAAGFIGYHLTKSLMLNPDELFGIDNLQKNHDHEIKLKRLEQLHIDQKLLFDGKHSRNKNLTFFQIDLLEKQKLEDLFSQHNFDVVIHLAAQTGVRQSATHSQIYIDNNITAFNNLLECCREFNVKRMVYASSSSVYGMHKNIPSSETNSTDAPTSIYAVTKKTCELLASTYTLQNNMISIGLRFFTVYGPWCRTDMAAYIFMKALVEKAELNLFNYGDMLRDYTYVGDVCNSIVLICRKILSDKIESPYHEVYNIGNRNATTLGDYLSAIENEIGVRASYQLKPMQDGEVQSSYADTKKLEDFIGFKPDTPLSKGVKEMAAWFRDYNKSL